MLRPAESSEITKYPSISWCQVARRWAIFSNVLASLCSSCCEAIISPRNLKYFLRCISFLQRKNVPIDNLHFQFTNSNNHYSLKTFKLTSCRAPGEKLMNIKRNHILTKWLSEKEKVDKDLPWQWLPPQTGPLCRRGEGGEGRRVRCRNTRSSFSNQASWQEEVKIKSRKMGGCGRIDPWGHSSKITERIWGTLSGLEDPSPRSFGDLEDEGHPAGWEGELAFTNRRTSAVHCSHHSLRRGSSWIDIQLQFMRTQPSVAKVLEAL